jgi:ketosteroid isomerase-like protein
MSDAAITALMKAFGRAFNAGDIDGILACVTPDFEWRLAEGPDAPWGRVVRGAEEVRRMLADRGKAMRNVRFSETEMAVYGDRVIGTFRLTGERSDGTACDWRGLDHYVVRDGKIACKDSYWKRIAAVP